MKTVPGTQGYERSVRRFIEISQTLSFFEVCAEFMKYLPSFSIRVLDVGAGAGQNSAALAKLGHAVVAVEPMKQFVDAARVTFGNLPITWLQDSLPLLRTLGESVRFDFILIEAVLHHLDRFEQLTALRRAGELLAPGGVLACSLRNGPAGLGSRVFPTNPVEMIENAGKLRLHCLFRKDNLSSALPNKENVRWSRLVFQK